MNKTELKRIIANYEAMKQPQPCRPLTWAEVLKTRKTTPLVVEYREGTEELYHYGKERITWRLIQISAAYARQLDRDVTGEKTKYNRTFRFWPRMPTRRERKAAKWEA